MRVDAKFVLSLIDLTRLNESDTAQDIDVLCQKAKSMNVAAVCVLPRFVKQAVLAVKNTPVKVATVANFPSGAETEENVLHSIQQSLQEGAQEIDLVFPYGKYLSGAKEESQQFIKKCKETIGNQALLKVILETGALQEPLLIADVCEDVLQAGADFLKTSTGKIPIGATLEAAETLLLAIQRSNRPVGFKASGGIRRIEDALSYIDLARQIMGKEWVTPQTFRIGASQLADVLHPSRPV